MTEVPAFHAIFGRPRPIIGVIHLPPLPGSPRFRGELRTIADRVREDARALADGGAAAMILENFGDLPFHPDRVKPHTVAIMTTLAMVARETAELPLGINVLRNDARAALAVAFAGGGAFIRVNVHVGVALTDQGLISGQAADSLRYRRELDAGIAIFADVGVKHAAPLAPRPVEEEAEEAARRGLADALILTGSMTGRPVDPVQLAAVKRAVPETPLLAGSGVTPDNVAHVFQFADGIIAGTVLKVGGEVENPVDPAAVARLVEAAAATD